MRSDFDNNIIVCVVGLGYVGLPLAESFSKSLKVIGFDNNGVKLKKLIQNNDNRNLNFTNDPHEINHADFIVIAVPTPVTKSKEPDLSYIKNAARIVAANFKKDSVVVLESTVYPGVTEEVVKPILEGSGLVCGLDFKLAYSPERINPGDEEHTVDNITKVVSGIDDETTELVAQLYSKVTPNIFKAKNIMTAEAAKVIENVQRDLNIALMNELAIIFDKLGLSTRDVIEAAATKWNFHRYSPGLVGGHCIPVDPYYLVHRAKELSYHPQVILAGRAINDYMASYLADLTVRALVSAGKAVKGSRVLIMGLTYKANVADTRETPAKEIIKKLKEWGVNVLGYDPLITNAEDEFEINIAHDLKEVIMVDGIVLAVPHDIFKKITLEDLKAVMNDNPVLIDVLGIFDKKKAKDSGFYYGSL